MEEESMMRRLLILVPVLIVLLAAFGCGKKTRVTRLDPGTTVDLSGRWNDTDSQQVADAMVTSCLGSPWINSHVMDRGANPVIIVGSIRNKTTEHIDTEIFVKDLERACVVSGMVDVVGSALEREEIRDERLDQKVNAAPETVKEMGRELGADYMLIGSVKTQGDQSGDTELFFFSVDLELIDIETNRKVWIDNHKIKKLRERGRFKG
jgi:uncharacterized protein (TIGR02722 family)